MIKFTRQSVRPDGETLYRLEKDGEVLRENITLDEVVRAINRMDEERAGLRGTDCHTSAAALVRNDRLRRRAAEGVGPYGEGEAAADRDPEGRR